MSKSRGKDIIVLDTSVILYDSDCVSKFDGYDMVVPLIVLDEIDKFRRTDSQIGRNARRFIRGLKAMKSSDNDYSEGLLRKESGETIWVQKLKDHTYLNEVVFDRDKNDDKIIAVCLELSETYPNRSVYLVTKDIALNVKASTLGIENKEYDEDSVVRDSSNLYTGTYKLPVLSPNAIDVVYSEGSIGEEFVDLSGCELYDNAGVVLYDPGNSNSSVLTIYRDGFFVALKKNYKRAHNVKPMNKEQSFAMELLFDPDVKLVSLTGAAGCGKTLLAVASALSQIDSGDGGSYDRLVISRPIQPLGKDIGYLPGLLEDKMAPWMGPILDSVEFVFNGDRDKYYQLKEFGKIEIEPLTYIRGRSLSNTIFIFDEAQSTSPHEMKTVITRMGNNSKLILCGDIYQIDNNYLDMTSNGLTYAIEKFKYHDIAGHITLTKGQRSKLATLAAEIL